MSPEEMDGVVSALRKGGPCKTCGRPDAGHWLGCAETVAVKPLSTDPDQLNTGNPDECFFSGCLNPKRPPGKGPKPKYCTEHSDPKNRK